MCLGRRGGSRSPGATGGWGGQQQSLWGLGWPFPSTYHLGAAPPAFPPPRLLLDSGGQGAGLVLSGKTLTQDPHQALLHTALRMPFRESGRKEKRKKTRGKDLTDRPGCEEVDNLTTRGSLGKGELRRWGSLGRRGGRGLRGEGSLPPGCGAPRCQVTDSLLGQILVGLRSLPQAHPCPPVTSSFSEKPPPSTPAAHNIHQFPHLPPGEVWPPGLPSAKVPGGGFSLTVPAPKGSSRSRSLSIADPKLLLACKSCGPRCIQRGGHLLLPQPPNPPPYTPPQPMAPELWFQTRPCA